VNSVTTFNTAKAYIGVAIFSALTFAERSGVRSKRDERKLRTMKTRGEAHDYSVLR